MISGTYPLSRGQLLARELQCQGLDLECWAQDQGVSLELVYAILDGRQEDSGGILHKLAQTLGVSVDALTRLVAA